MLEKTLLSALATYRIQLQIGSSLHTQAEIDSILERVEFCEEHIRQGNKVDGTWMAQNHTVLSKAVTCAHDLVHRNYIGDSDEIDEEHQDLNKCMLFFKKFYEQRGIDIEYMSIL